MAELEHPGGKRAESARARRAEQLRRWRGSLTEQEPAERQGAGRQLQTRRGSPRVRFEDGAVFLAACSSGDTDEVKKLLARGADINTVNVDGLTALHQVGLLFLLCVCGGSLTCKPVTPVSCLTKSIISVSAEPSCKDHASSVNSHSWPPSSTHNQGVGLYLKDWCHPGDWSVFVFPSTYLGCHGDW